MHVIARAVDRDHVYDLYAAGCRDIIRETFDSSLRLGRSALEALGVTHEVAMQVTREFETLDKRFILEMAQLYRRGTPNHLNPAYAAKVIELNAEWAQQLRMKKARAEETLANAPNSSLAPESMQCSDVESRG